MKEIFVKLRNLFIQLKVYMGRTNSYIGLINTAMILFLFMSNLEKYSIDINIQSWIVPLFIIGLFGMFLFGFLEDKLGFYKQEQKTTQSRSPYFSQILKKLDKLEEKVNRLEKKK